MRLCIVTVVCACAGHLLAADLYVNNATGRDTNDGTKPDAAFATIAKAIQAAGAGDTIHLANTGKPYRESADFYGRKGGEPNRPLTLDGHGATISGADVCPADGWSPGPGGAFTRSDIDSRGILVVNDELVFETRAMNVLAAGEFCNGGDGRLYFHPPKGAKLAALEIEVSFQEPSPVRLDANLWQRSGSAIAGVLRYPLPKPVVEVKVGGAPAPLVTAKERLPEGGWCQEANTLYYRPPAGKAPRDLRIECSRRVNGVQLGGTTAYVTVRNLNVVHVYDDGYNLHGRVTHAEFYNCNARQCGDQAFSAHDECESLVDGAVWEDCQMGVANVNQGGFSITRNVVIARSRATGFLIVNRARHVLENAILIDNPSQIAAPRLEANNVLIVRTAGGPAEKAQAITCGLGELRRVTAVGNTGLLRADKDSNILIADSVLGGGQGVIHVRAADPMAILRFSNVVYGGCLAVEWGVQYPWEKLPLDQWLAKAGGSTKCLAQDLSALDDLRKGALPAKVPQGAGCDAKLIEKYLQYVSRK